MAQTNRHTDGHRNSRADSVNITRFEYLVYLITESYDMTQLSKKRRRKKDVVSTSLKKRPKQKDVSTSLTTEMKGILQSKQKNKNFICAMNLIYCTVRSVNEEKKKKTNPRLLYFFKGLLS